MKLKIISPATEQEFDIAWIDVTTHVGNFVILQDHAPMMATVKPKETITFCLENGKQESIIPESGIVEVMRKKVVLLLSKAPSF